MSWNKFFVKNFYKFKGHIDLSVHGLDLKGDPENYHFWQSCSRGDWEPNTFKLLKEFLNSESIFLDIGAWIGPLSVFASKLCGQVYSFEPDQFAFRKLVENILLNDSKNIHAISAATGDGFKHYLQGNVLKYLWRFDYKDKPLQDLQKAQWYLNALVEEVMANES